MSSPTLSAIRFLREWRADPNGRSVSGPAREVEIVVDGEPVPMSVHSPGAIGDEPSHKWIALHGVTRPGRHHPSLRRFCRSLAASGATVVVPEIPEWTELDLAPDRTGPSVKGALDWLEAEGESPGRPGVIGFSFGAPQALRVAADPRLGSRIGGVVAYGGYVDVRRTVRYQLTGTYAAHGMSFDEPPDPYGRWIMAANHLCGVPEHADAVEVAGALRELAVLAGDRGVPADGPEMAEQGSRIRDALPPEHRLLFDLIFRGPAGGGVDRGEGMAGPVRRDQLDQLDQGDRLDRLDRLNRLADQLADAALRTDPLLDVTRALEDVACPVELVHGRHDRLIPWGESVGLERALPTDVPVNLAVTRMFGHSREEGGPGIVRAIPEALRFFRSLRRVVGLLDLAAPGVSERS